MYILKSEAWKEYNKCKGYRDLDNQPVGFKEYSEGTLLGEATIKDYKGNNYNS